MILINFLYFKAQEDIKELVVRERIESTIPLTYLICFLMAYYGPNAEFLGNIKLTIWQYQAVSDAQLYKNIQSLLIMFGIDLLSGIINGILLWKACNINVFRVMQKVQKEFWLIMGVQEAFFFVQVGKILTTYMNIVLIK